MIFMVVLVLDLIQTRKSNILEPRWAIVNGPKGSGELDVDNRVCDLVSGTYGRVFLLVYIDALVHGFQP